MSNATRDPSGLGKPGGWDNPANEKLLTRRRCAVVNLVLAFLAFVCSFPPLTLYCPILFFASIFYCLVLVFHLLYSTHLFIYSSPGSSDRPGPHSRLLVALLVSFCFLGTARNLGCPGYFPTTNHPPHWAGQLG